MIKGSIQEEDISSVQFSRSVVSKSLQPHESQHTRPPCPSPTPGVHPDSCPLSQWCHPAISEEDITIVNIYAPNIGAPQYIRQILTNIKGEIDSNTIIVGDFNSPLTTINRSSKQKINKETHLKWYIRWDGYHWYLQDIPSKCRRIHLLLKCTWNILQDRSHLVSQIKPQEI